jgi:hypothetical protein
MPCLKSCCCSSLDASCTAVNTLTEVSMTLLPCLPYPGMYKTHVNLCMKACNFGWAPFVTVGPLVLTVGASAVSSGRKQKNNLWCTA